MKIAQVQEVKAYEEKPIIADVVHKVRILESSGGRNDGCLARGGVNGYGYAQSTHTWNCFKTHEEVQAKVINWFNTKLETMDLPTALCYYNTGYKVNDCEYYKNYLKLQ